MTKQNNKIDTKIIKLLQNQGLIKKEAEACLKREVYQLQPDEIQKIKNYNTHFGLHAKDKLIQEILDLRRELLLSKLSKQQLESSNNLVHQITDSKQQKENRTDFHFC